MLLLVGVALAVTAVQTRKLYLVVMIEGKAQRIGFDSTDIIADVYVVAGATMVFMAGGTEIKGKGICQPYHGILREDLTELENNIENILHALAAK